jgi:hypothetical protein
LATVAKRENPNRRKVRVAVQRVEISLQMYKKPDLAAQRAIPAQTALDPSRLHPLAVPSKVLESVATMHPTPREVLESATAIHPP